MKNINFNIRTIVFLFLFSGLHSCNDWVEVDMPNNQLGTNDVFTDVYTANAALAGVYANMRDISIVSGSLEGSGFLLSLYSDDLIEYIEDQNGYTDVFNNTIQPTNSVIESVWNFAYQQIYATNSIIQGVQNSPLPQSEKMRIKSEAVVARTLLYFYLQQIFGEIPYTQSLDYEYNKTLFKISENDLLNQLVEDMSEMVPFLDENYRNPERIYPNRSVAKLVLAKLYLSLGNNVKAEEYAKQILQSSNYQFQNNLNEVFKNASTHILWQFPPEYYGEPVSEAQLYYFENSYPHLASLSTDLMNSFDNNDLRKSTWVKEVNFNGETWYRPNKYKNIESNYDEYSIMFRLEEVYFILAEALAKQDKLSEANLYINYTRIRAGLSPIENNSQDQFLIELLLEKRKEFFAEMGHRFMDLKRLNKLNDLVIVKPFWVDFKKVWPLPQKELLLNPNLNPQNNGF